MRLLWLESSESPWSKGDGWSVISACGIELIRTADIGEAQVLLGNKNPEVLVASIEVPGVNEFLEKLRPQSKKSKIKVIVVSAKWGKAEFKEHSKTPGAAHRYAKSPMPIDGFIKVLEEITGEKLERRSEPAPPTLNFSSPLAQPERPTESLTETIPYSDTQLASPKREIQPAELRSGDAETLRNYLRIKEDELSAAVIAQEEMRAHNESLQKEIHDLQLKLRDQEHKAEESSMKAESSEKNRQEAEEKLAQTKSHLDSEVRAYQDRVKQLEKEVDGSGQRYEELRNRVRKDIRRIRTHERELEAKLELARKDSETLLNARDQKVLELQRRIDALEFDLDQVQDSRVQAEMEAERYLAKLSRVARALHIAIGMVEEDVARDHELDELEPFVKDKTPEAEPTIATPAADAPPAPVAAAEPPPAADAAQAPLPDLEALASDGEPTRIVSVDELKNESGGGEAAG